MILSTWIAFFSLDCRAFSRTGNLLFLVCSYVPEKAAYFSCFPMYFWFCGQPRYVYLMIALPRWANLRFKKTAVTKVRDQVGGKGRDAIPHVVCWDMGLRLSVVTALTFESLWD